MTFELNYKSDGDILYAADLMENLSFPIVNLLNSMIDGATSTNQDNYVYLNYNDFDETNSNVVSTGTAVHGGSPTAGNEKIFVEDLYDDYNSSIDANKWTSILGGGTVGESLTAIYAQNGAKIYSKGNTTSLNFKTANTACKFYCVSSGASTSVQLTDGTNFVDIKDVPNGYYEVVSNIATDTFSVWENGTQILTNQSMAGLTTNAYLLIDGSGSGGEIYLGRFGKKTTSTSYNLIWDNQTISGTTYISKHIWTNPQSDTIAYNYSINNGGSYTVGSDKGLVDVGSFTQLKLKITITTVASIVVNAQNVAEITKGAFYYG